MEEFNLQQYDAFIFDFDGTLFQTEKLVIYAFEETFRRLEIEDGFNGDVPNEAQILSVIGNTEKELWDKLLPDYPKELHKKANRYLLEYEIAGVKEGYGALYPDVLDTLIQLKNQGKELFIASNGLKEYIDEVTKAFRIDHLFTAMYTAGEYKTDSKTDLIKLILKSYKIHNGIMVGDRLSDIVAGNDNGLFTIGCDFGFSRDGELNDAKQIIGRFADLLSIVNTER